MTGNRNSDELHDCDLSASHRLQLVSSPMLDQLRHRWDRKYPTQLRSITRHSHSIVRGGLTGVC